jgi:hypothetical protein
MFFARLSKFPNLLIFLFAGLSYRVFVITPTNSSNYLSNMLFIWWTNFTFKNLQKIPWFDAASRKKSFHISFEKERSRKLTANHKSFTDYLFVPYLTSVLTISTNSSLFLFSSPSFSYIIPLLTHFSTIPLFTQLQSFHCLFYHYNKVFLAHFLNHQWHW